MKLGIIGLNPGNGHPFSFSAIVNGYSDAGFAKADWPVIHEYLRANDKSEFGFPGVRVTHAWTQDAAKTRILCEASLIEHAAKDPAEMIGQVDGVLLCRHDYEMHHKMAMPFLTAGLPVYVDKPLSLVPAELKELRPFLERGKLMSCSAMAFARELDELHAALPEYGTIKLIRAAVVLDWEKYGVHMVDSVLALGHAHPVAVMALPARHDSFAIEMDDGSLFQVDALGEAPKNFRLDVFGSKRDSTHQLFDNFHAFRRCIGHFIKMVETGTPQIDPGLTLTSMKILIAGNMSRAEKRRVALDDIRL